MKGTDIYQKYTARKRAAILLLLLFIAIAAVFAVNAGSTNLNPYQVVQAVIGKGSNVSGIVIWQIRLPRILAAVIAGAGLSAAGCVMQNNLRNPLASPSTLGISNAAAFGANMAIIVFGAGSIRSSAADAVTISNPYLVTVSAFIWSNGGCGDYFAAGKAQRAFTGGDGAGRCGSKLAFSAGTILIQYFAQDVQIAAAVFWTLETLKGCME